MKHFQVHNDRNKPPKTIGTSAGPSRCKCLLHTGGICAVGPEAMDGVMRMPWRLSLIAADRANMLVGNQEFYVASKTNASSHSMNDR